MKRENYPVEIQQVIKEALVKKKLTFAKIFAVVLSVAFVFTGINAQTVIKTEDGRTMYLYEDGTWSFNPPKEDTVIASEPTCEECVVQSKDRMTGKPTVSADFLLSSKNGAQSIRLFMKKTWAGNIMVRLYAKSSAEDCIPEKSKMIVAFTDGTTLESVNTTTFNCDGKQIHYFGSMYGTAPLLKELRVKDVKSIRIMTKKGFVEESLSAEKSVWFRTMINCMLK